jgi:hypothetical protein
VDFINMRSKIVESLISIDGLLIDKDVSFIFIQVKCCCTIFYPTNI